MNSKYQCRFVLLDFGHPMSANAIKNIINSLENILLLSLAFSQNAKETNLGISVLNSDFAIIHFESNLRRNYDLVVKNLNGFLKKPSGRITVQKFKDLLSSSVEAISCELQRKIRTGEILSEQLIQIAVVSKKTAHKSMKRILRIISQKLHEIITVTLISLFSHNLIILLLQAWVLADILASVTSKVQKLSVENFKIVQISNETHQNTNVKNSLIDCIFCSDDPHDLNGFFKDWLLNPQQELRILVSKDANLEMKCEMEDCVFNPIKFSSKFDLFDDIQNKGRNILIGGSTQVCKLEIVSRLPVNGLCPTLVFGIPRRVRATRWSESQANSRIFKQLCRELNRTGEGLLAKSALPSDPITFHFLTSDGDMILMNDVAPNELHLPKREEFSDSVDFFEDERDASVVKNCLRNIKLLNEFKPENFSSGVYNFLRYHIDRMKQSKSSFARFDANVSGINSPKKENSRNSKNEEDNEFKNDRRKRPKPGSDRELENVHPALLPPEEVEKYRKIDEQAFNLPELGKDFM